MSGPGQYPGNYNNNPLGGQFNPQQQMVSPMGVNAGQQGGGNMIPMYNTQGGGMMGQQQQQQPGLTAPGGMTGPGGVGVMSPSVGMQSPSHVQQQQMLQQSQQMHMQQQQQQQQQMSMVGNIPGSIMTAGPVGTNVLQSQQQPQQALPQQHHSVGISMQQQSAQTSQASSMLTMAQPIPHKEINIVALSRLGQETVQDITSRFQEIFAALKVIQPTANRDNNTEKKVQEYFRTIRLLFKRVRIIYEKCNDGYPQGMEYTNVESLIPYKDESDHRIEPTQCEEYRKALQENQELIETVKLKNRQLREIIDRTRIIIWEINTMLSMRRS